ncbi:MAG: molecular chaperone DnaK, partial [Alphaproteobacteria bacterium]|nr:molecular chaperone DnaK [Alphaproteobacteria bacterium]
KISGSSGLDDAEIERMVKDAELHKEEDKKRKEAVDARNQADALAHQTEKSLGEMGDAISAEEKAKIEAALKELKDVLANESASKDEIDAKVKSLSEASHKLAEAMYKKEQGGASDGEQPKSKKDDDVIDAEVE